PKVVLVFDSVRIECGSFSAWMSLPNQGICLPNHLQDFVSTVGPIDGSILQMFLGRRCIPFSNVCPVNRLGKENVPVAAEIDVRFLSGQYQEVAIREPAAGFVIGFQFAESQRSGIFGMTISVEIADVGDVDSESLHGGNPGSTGVQAASFSQTFRECRVEMRHHVFVTRQLFIAVAMRVGHYCIARLFRWSWTSVPIKRHSLPRSGWSIVERVDLFDPFLVIALFGRILSNA